MQVDHEKEMHYCKKIKTKKGGRGELHLFIFYHVNISNKYLTLEVANTQLTHIQNLKNEKHFHVLYVLFLYILPRYSKWAVATENSMTM